MPILELLQLLGAGMLLGFSIAAPPGPVNATIASQVATRSWSAGLLVGLGALTADTIFFVITFYGLTKVAAGTGIGPWLFGVGGVMMLYFAYSTLRRARSRVDAKTGGRSRFPYLLGLSIGITNPFQVGWWLTVGLGVLAEFGLRVLLGFLAGIAIWVLSYTTALAWAVTRYYSLYPYVNYASGMMLAGFGIWFLFSAFAALL